MPIPIWSVQPAIVWYILLGVRSALLDQQGLCCILRETLATYL